MEGYEMFPTVHAIMIEQKHSCERQNLVSPQEHGNHGWIRAMQPGSICANGMELVAQGHAFYNSIVLKIF